MRQDKYCNKIMNKQNLRPQLLEVLNFLRNNPQFSKELFDSRNIVGDPMETVYENNGVTIDYCSQYDYSEIFGLTTAEFNIINMENEKYMLMKELYSVKEKIITFLKQLNLEQLEELGEVVRKLDLCPSYSFTEKRIPKYFGIYDKEMVNDFYNHYIDLLEEKHQCKFIRDED